MIVMPRYFGGSPGARVLTDSKDVPILRSYGCELFPAGVWFASDSVVLGCRVDDGGGLLIENDSVP